MQIPFSLPHANPSPGNAYALGALQKCVERLRIAYAKYHPRGNRPPTGVVSGNFFIFNLPDTFTPDADTEENAEALRALLDCLCDIDLDYLRRCARYVGDPSIDNLYRSRIRYKRTTEWDPISVLYSKGYGDCKSLSAAVIAQYAYRGMDSVPVFRWIRRKDGSGNFDFHILVQTVDGFEDPSKACGMGQDENKWF